MNLAKPPALMARGFSQDDLAELTRSHHYFGGGERPRLGHPFNHDAYLANVPERLRTW